MMETPCYEIDLERVRSNWRSLGDAIRPDRLYYAMKCNSAPDVLKTIASFDDGRFEVASDGEMELLAGLGVSADRVICSTPVKPVPMLKRLVQLGCGYFVFDTLAEFAKIKSLAPEARKIVRLDVTGAAPDTIPFGMSAAELRGLMECGCIDADAIDGVAVYVSANKDLQKMAAVLEVVGDVLKMLPRGRIVNLGGNYRLPCEVEDGYYAGLVQKMSEIRERTGCVFYAEPGRSVVKSACALRTRVVGVKDRGDCRWVYLDAGVPTGISYKPPRIEVVGGTRLADQRHYRFYDATCSHRELFDDCLDVEICIGSELVLHSVGSYYLSKASTFHGWRLPKIVCV